MDTNSHNIPDSFSRELFKTSSGTMALVCIGHASLMIEWQGMVIHVDPHSGQADYESFPVADLLLLTHEHHDHLDLVALEQICSSQSDVICPKLVAERIGSSVQQQRMTILHNGQSVVIRGLRIEAVPAYNIEGMRSPGVPFHPPGHGNGYVINFGGLVVYLAGDTEPIPEMHELPKIEIAFLPLKAGVTMTPEMAARAAKIVQPKILYPYHTASTDVSMLVEFLSDEPDIELRVRDMAWIP